MAIVNGALTLKDLPTSPEGKTGWPWTEENQPLPRRMPNGLEWPRITIVTPSYNQGQFIEETIRSVLLQGYTNLEYIIIDGGSTDNSIEIIKKYEPYLAYWISEPDRGQSHALNKGFRKGTGNLVGWQNSDDYYNPGAFLFAAQASVTYSDANIIYGNVNYVDEGGTIIFEAEISQFDFKKMLPWLCILNQATFFKSKIFIDGNFIDEDKQHVMDYDFFWRLALANYQFKFIPAISASHRQHSKAKGHTQKDIADKEFFEVYKFLYKDTNLEADIKEKVLSCMRGCCLNDFAELKFGLFRKRITELVAISSFRSLTPILLLKYIFSLIGERNLFFIKKVRNYIFGLYEYEEKLK
ncbi:glycosyltransferase family 2 protein [Nostoc sp.]|uniref:glycosyltransferase family 2 protein n=1 Tax=Nostoc sp. TaxID=1180 RepID=UPI002FF6BC44